MSTPENRQRFKKIIEVSGQRAILDYAGSLASRNNSDVGIKHLYEGVRAEMGDFLVRSDLQRKNIDPNQLERDLHTLTFFGDGNTKPITQIEPALSSYAKDVVAHAVNLARSRKNPIAQRVSARDLLESIAVVAHQKASEIADTLAKTRFNENPDNKDFSLKIEKGKSLMI